MKNKFNTMFRRFTALASAAVMLTAAGTGCSGKDKVTIQEPTDKLVIYSGPEVDKALKAALSSFKNLYPNVEVEYKEFGTSDDPEAESNYLETIKNELSSGKGPDLILMHSSEYDDIYRMMKSESFQDLNPLLENDESFDKGLYNETVFDSGVFEGKRYFIPISYSMRVLLTSQEALEAENITVDNNLSFDDFSNIMTNYVDKYESNMDKTFFTLEGMKLETFFPWNGMNLLDYEKKKVLIDNDDFKKTMELYKKYYNMDNREQESVLSTYTGDGAVMINSGSCLFESGILGGVSKALEVYSALLTDKTPVLSRFPSISDKNVATPKYMAAIRSGSPNQANAYSFIKILLSEDYQNKNAVFSEACLEIPVLKSALENGIDSWNKKWGGQKDTEHGVTLTALSDADKDKFIDIYSNVDACELYNNNLINFVWEAMEPYFKGERSYDECQKNLYNKLELYINE